VRKSASVIAVLVAPLSVAGDGAPPTPPVPPVDAPAQPASRNDAARNLEYMMCVSVV
jgi:hypothetical protein